MKTNNLIIIVLVIYAIFISIGYFTKEEKDDKTKEYKRALVINDSLEKVNDSLKVARTIDIQEAAKLRHSLDSIASIRPKNIKQTNNEVSRLHNSNTAGKLSIIDSILRARKGQR